MRRTTETRSEPGIGARVGSSRRRLGWSREELAVRSRLSWPAIAQIESGRRVHLRPATLSSLAGALGVTIDYLVRGGPADAPMLKHIALVYGDEEEFARSVGPFVSGGIEDAEAVMVVTTPANIEVVRETVGRDARRIEFVDSADWYTAPAATLAAYREFATTRVAAGVPWVRIVGEPVWAGRSAAEAGTWQRYESLINLAFASWPVTVMCPYDKRSVQPEIARQACATHPETIADGVIATSREYVDPDGYVLDSCGA